MNILRKLVVPTILASLILTSCKSNEVAFVIPPEEEGKMQIHTAVQRVFLNGPLDDINLYVRGAEELSRPQDITFTWDEKYQDCTVYLSENRGYTNSVATHVTRNRVSFNNLKIGTTYYFYVDTEEDDIIYEDSFTTSSEIIRNMYISGVTNARDLGGYPVEGNKTLNQGVIYRTSKLNDDDEEEVSVRISDRGINTMLNTMKVKTEIDLRRTDNNEVGGLKEGTSVLGNSVKYYQCPMDYSIDYIGGEDNDASLRKVFSILGNKDNYPLFFHCSIGTDRTGYVAHLINAMLGVKEEHLWRDYLFSNFANIGGKRSRSTIENSYPKLIKEQEGKTYQEKATKFLLDKGVKQSELDVIKEMMIPTDA